MKYAEQNLMKNEAIIYEAKKHWILFVRPLVIFIIAYAFSLTLRSGAGIGFLISVGITLLDLIPRAIKYFYSEFVVTNKRVLIKRGFISRDSTELLLSKLEGIQVDQNIFGRLLNYGTIKVSAANAMYVNRYPRITNPLSFRKVVQEQIEEKEVAKLQQPVM